MAKHGEPLRFFSSSIANPGYDCLVWPYANQRGYGVLLYEGRVRKVHQIVCELVEGPCPPGMEAAHWCGVSLCFNPKHVRWATKSENYADRKTHNTLPYGSGRKPFLTADQVREVRNLSKTMKSKDIAPLYGVSRAVIDMLLGGRSYKKVV